MPICPRCGKCLSSDQALTYHLNRKYRCGTWKCVKCNIIYNTKFQLQMHELQCMTTDKKEIPEVDYLLDFYNNINQCIVCIDVENKIKYCTPYSKSIFNINQHEMKQMNLNELLTDEMEINQLYSRNNELMLHIQKKVTSI